MVDVYCSWGTRQNTIEWHKSNANVPNQHLCNNYQSFELFVTSVLWTLGYNDFVLLICLPYCRYTIHRRCTNLRVLPSPTICSTFPERIPVHEKTPLWCHTECPSLWVCTPYLSGSTILDYKSNCCTQDIAVSILSVLVCRQLDLTSTSPDNHNRHPTTTHLAIPYKAVGCKQWPCWASNQHWSNYLEVLNLVRCQLANAVQSKVIVKSSCEHQFYHIWLPLLYQCQLHQLWVCNWKVEQYPGVITIWEAIRGSPDTCVCMYTEAICCSVNIYGWIQPLTGYTDDHMPQCYKWPHALLLQMTTLASLAHKAPHGLCRALQRTTVTHDIRGVEIFIAYSLTTTYTPSN